MAEVKLQSDKTVTTVSIGTDGSLVVECFDFSDEAHDHLGNDVGYTATVGSDDKRRILSLLLGETPAPSAEGERDRLLLDLIRAKFASYYQIKGWLEEHGIRCSTTFDPWA